MIRKLFTAIYNRFERVKFALAARSIRAKITRKGLGRWAVYRFNQNRAGGHVSLGVVTRENALRVAATMGNIVYVDDDYCLIFINDKT